MMSFMFGMQLYLTLTINYDSLGDLSDGAKSDGVWLVIEDKNLYKIQKETKESVSYSTGKLAASSSIHPKQMKVKRLPG